MMAVGRSAGRLCWINTGQVDKWGNAFRPEGVRWTGTVHREWCSQLGEDRRRLTPTQIDATGVQTCITCGGDGKPIKFERIPDQLGCHEWERERGHEPHYRRPPD